MSLDKNKTIAEAGSSPYLRNHDAQKMLKALVEVWSEELANGGHIELENFLVLEVKYVNLLRVWPIYLGASQRN